MKSQEPFQSMKPLSAEMACLSGIQNKVQAVWVASLSQEMEIIGPKIRQEVVTFDFPCRVQFSFIPG